MTRIIAQKPWTPWEKKKLNEYIATQKANDTALQQPEIAASVKKDTAQKPVVIETETREISEQKQKGSPETLRENGGTTNISGNYVVINMKEVGQQTINFPTSDTAKKKIKNSTKSRTNTVKNIAKPINKVKKQPKDGTANTILPLAPFSSITSAKMQNASVKNHPDSLRLKVATLVSIKISSENQKSNLLLEKKLNTLIVIGFLLIFLVIILILILFVKKFSYVPNIRIPPPTTQ